MSSDNSAVDTSIAKGKLYACNVLVILETTVVWCVWMFMALMPEAGSRWARQLSFKRALALHSIFADVPYGTVLSVAKRQMPLGSAPDLLAKYSESSAMALDEIGFYAYLMHRHTRMGAKVLLGFLVVALLVLLGLHSLLLFLLAGALGLAGFGLLVLGAFLLG